jgi:hypothetical protein
MHSASLIVLETELKAIRMLRSAPNIAVVRASLDREEVLLSEMARLRGESSNVLPLAASFSRRTEDPEESK